MEQQPAFNLRSGYVLRGVNALPKSGMQRPWVFSHNYIRDAIDHRLVRVDEAMVFGRTADNAPHPA